MQARTSPLPSPLCVLFLREGSIPPGPEVDPEGWTHSKGTLLRGTRANKGDLFIDCKVCHIKYDNSALTILLICFHFQKMAFANPVSSFLIARRCLLLYSTLQLTYTKSQPLPFRLTLESSESLTCYNDPVNFPVCLVRSIGRHKNQITSQNSSVKSNRRNMVHCCEMGILWQRTGNTIDDTKVEFEGEFPLEATLIPSFEFLKPSVRVSSFTSSKDVIAYCVAQSTL